MRLGRLAAGLLGLTLVAGSAAADADRVSIGAFAIDRTEVSIASFAEHARRTGLVTAAEAAGGGQEYAGGWTQRRGWTYRTPYGEPAGDGEPAVHVTWAEAEAYCASRGGRLPTFAEWRQAAYTESRAAPADGFEKGRTYPYPVGDTPEGMNNNRRRHVPTGTTKRGVNGLHDMGGNVWEWVADRRGGEALTAGGSWWYGPEQTRVSGAQWKAAGFVAVYIGFRCAYDIR